MATTNGKVEAKDDTLTHAWIKEYPKVDPDAVITPAGLENIASHKYKAGHTTYLDRFFNPFWTFLTNCLPLWLAPNMVTTLGGLHCGVSYAVLWYYSYNFDKAVPDWVLFLSAYSTFAYYTLDCMDGKQSRRTGTSSPLGQLFDHGFDCICNLSHLSNVAGITVLGTAPNWYLCVQGSLQYSFFMAQWEEYYTHVLPHAVGNYCGVTEVNYGIALLTFFSGFIDRSSFWTRGMGEIIPNFSDLLTYTQEHDLPSLTQILQTFGTLELRQLLFISWTTMICLLVSSSFYRVFCHVQSNSIRFSAVSKMISPAILCVAPFLIPPSLRVPNIRKISVATGLMFSLLTKKMIVYSMAKMKFASLQVEILPFLLFCVWLRLDGNITPYGAKILFRWVCVYHAFLLLRWCSRAIRQICARLDIYCFTIKPKKKAA